MTVDPIAARLRRRRLWLDAVDAMAIVPGPMAVAGAGVIPEMPAAVWCVVAALLGCAAMAIAAIPGLRRCAPDRDGTMVYVGLRRRPGHAGIASAARAGVLTVAGLIAVVPMGIRELGPMAWIAIGIVAVVVPWAWARPGARSTWRWLTAAVVVMAASMPGDLPWTVVAIGAAVAAGCFGVMAVDAAGWEPFGPWDDAAADALAAMVLDGSVAARIRRAATHVSISGVTPADRSDVVDRAIIAWYHRHGGPPWSPGGPSDDPLATKDAPDLSRRILAAARPEHVVNLPPHLVMPVLARLGAAA